jgi:UDP-N-acetylmuramyl pentapeptide phosphotransferase/UDP-N-acetylglucosamine-1-phosphate transferase
MAWASFAPIALLCVALAYWCNRKWYGFLPDDLPRPGRKQHRRPVPLAGIALAPAVVGALLWSSLWLPAIGAAIAAGIGYVDDWSKERARDFDWRWKGVALLVATALVATHAHDPRAEPWSWLGAWLLAFCLVNATNFLDNTDGVAAALAAAALLTGAGDQPALQRCGIAALVFVPWNWPRPVLFLGDSGAFLLGIAIATMTTAQLPHGPAALLPVAVLLADFAQVVTARIVLGVPPWVGDRRHLTHIVQNLGLRRVLVAPLFAGVAVAIALLR